MNKEEYLIYWSLVFIQSRVCPMNIKANFFESLYQNNPDPWHFASSTYELNRYKRICEIVHHQKPSYVFEAGCSIGILTEQLAHLAEFVEAIDISSTATLAAQIRCCELRNVRIQWGSLGNYSIPSKADLIILSEIGYYFSREEWRNIIKNIATTCTPPFYLLASHWLGTSADHILSGDEVHSIIHSLGIFELKHSERNKDFRLDYWVKK